MWDSKLLLLDAQLLGMSRLLLWAPWLLLRYVRYLRYLMRLRLLSVEELREGGRGLRSSQ